MAELANCRICGKPIIASENMLCSKCYKEREEKFERVKAYLRIVPGARISEIERETGVEGGMILEFLKEGRLALLHPDPSVDLRCVECGEPITTGLYCEGCKRRMVEELKEASRKEKGRGYYSRDYG